MRKQHLEPLLQPLKEMFGLKGFGMMLKHTFAFQPFSSLSCDTNVKNTSSQLAPILIGGFYHFMLRLKTSINAWSEFQNCEHHSFSLTYTHTHTYNSLFWHYANISFKNMIFFQEMLINNKNKLFANIFSFSYETKIFCFILIFVC